MLLQTSSTHRSLRSSLYPFIRNPIDQKETESAYTNAQDSTKKVMYKFLERYHDQSFIVKQKKASNLQKYARLLNRITRLFRTKKQLRQQQSFNRQKREQNLTFNPQSTGLYIWNIIIALSILYHFFEIPIVLFFTELAFKSQFHVNIGIKKGGFGIICNIISLIALMVNIVYVIPNTQYYHNGFLVTNHQKIIQRYRGWRLVLDVVGYVVLFVFAVSNTYSLIYMKLFFYLMAYRLSKVDDCLQRKIELTKVRLAAYKLCRLILLLCFLVVWLGSIFFAIDYYYYQQGPNATYTGSYLWLMDSAATNYTDIIQQYDDWLVWFNYSIYWCIQTVSMVGFGDITGKNPVEATYTSLIITLVVVSYAFFITGVWEIVAEAREFTSYQNKQWKKYKQYQKDNMRPLDRKKQVSEKGIRYRQLKNKVGSYLFEMWSHEKAYSQINILEVLQKSLTPELKDQVFVNYRQHLFQRIDLFRELEEVQTKNYKYIFRELIFKITEKKYAKDEVILNAGELSLNLIYLVNGKLTVSYPNSNYHRTFHHNFSSTNVYADKNSNFGVKQFFTQQKMPYSVICDSFCQTSELALQCFINSIRSVEQFYVIFYLKKSKFCELRDQIKLYNQDQLTGQQCIECGSNEHDIENCQDCDITMCYKRHWMKIRFGNKNIQVQSKDKCSKIPFRRKFIKSKKIINITSKRGKELHIQKIHNYNLYYPQHNLSFA